MAAVAAVAALAMVSSCRLKDQSAPSLVGPSELGLSVNVTASPDSVNRDGASQTQVVVYARDASARPYANLSMHLGIECVTASGRQPADFGTLSARTVATGSDGRATAVYTAPADNSPLNEFCNSDLVWITATPILDNYANQLVREVQIRLLTAGPIVPSSNLVPAFEYLPESPRQGESVAFDATTSTGSIATYAWNFGDGATASGSVVAHAFNKTGSYQVTLTVADAVGRASSTTRIVAVGPGPVPTASFTYSPTAPSVNQPVYFNASESTAAAGRSIVGYSWEFGDGTGASGQFPSHTYTAAASYVVSLTVTDDVGRTATTSQTVSIAAAAGLTAEFTMSPTSGTAPVTISFNASGSTAASGRTIVSYAWDYGNTVTQTLTTPGGAQATYTVANTYVITLTITDDQGNTASTSATITIS